MNLGQALKEKRKLLKLRIKDVAIAIQRSTRYISYIESGNRLPGRSTLFKICSFYKISIDELPKE